MAAVIDEAAVQEVVELIEGGQSAEALDAVLPLITKLENAYGRGADQATSEKVYYNFADTIQGFLFAVQSKEERRILPASLPYAQCYCLAGQALALMERHEEAIPYLSSAVDWDPSSPSLQMLLARSCRALGDWKSFIACLNSAFPLITVPEDMATYQCYSGLYYLAKDKLELGIACLQANTRWKKLELANQALLSLAAERGVEKVRMDQSTVVGVLIAGGEHILPLESTLQSLVDLATTATVREDYKLAMAALSRVIAFTDDEELKQQRDKLRKLATHSVHKR
ncbi:MAG: hypothetical protein Q4E12_05685 [Coriobacteriia bacterium]|nr:hypothetical protein [Coriobacteriia bacterium]